MKKFLCLGLLLLFSVCGCRNEESKKEVSIKADTEFVKEEVAVDNEKLN